MSPWWGIGEYKIGFYHEKDKADVPHVHVENDKGWAKFSLNPVVLVRNGYRNEYESNKAKKVVEENENWLIQEYRRRHESLHSDA